jgi:hypothetical protein
MGLCGKTSLAHQLIINQYIAAVFDGIHIVIAIFKIFAQ